MNQFTVPQFIDVEDKIFGPVTSRQFIIMLCAGLIVFIAFKLADFALFVFTLVVVGGFALVLAFVKINGQSFHFFLLNIFQNFKQPSRRVWQKVFTKAELDEWRNHKIEVLVSDRYESKKISHAKIRDLTLLVNTGGYYKGDDT